MVDSAHQSFGSAPILWNLFCTWKIMSAVNCNKKKINRAEIGDIRFWQDTSDDECGDVCNLPVWTFQAIIHQRSSVAWKKLQVINSALREMLRNAKPWEKYYRKSQFNPAHWCNQSNGTHLKSDAETGLSPKHTQCSGLFLLMPAKQLCVWRFVPDALSSAHGGPG